VESQLANEREKLLRAYYADAIDVATLKREHARINAEVAEAESQLATDRERLKQAAKVIDLALQLHRRVRVPDGELNELGSVISVHAGLPLRSFGTSRACVSTSRSRSARGREPRAEMGPGRPGRPPFPEGGSRGRTSPGRR
jgi:hypothetical protein